VGIPYGKRSFLQDPWRYCARCGEKRHINNDMEWQRGKLMCKQTCLDVKLIGDREAIIAQVLGDGQEEFAPVQKLREPDTTITQDDIFI
jgi:hypothetical protein